MNIDIIMNIYGIITGDIVGSTKLKKQERDNLLDILYTTINNISSRYNKTDSITFEMFRGDSFQIKTTNVKDTLRVALLIRLSLISARDNSSSNKKSTWDARLSIGIGSIDYAKDTIGISDGEAFHYSGRAFDSLKKTSRLIIRTSDDKLNDEFDVECVMADAVIKSLSNKQAAITYIYILEGDTQKNIAEKLKVTPQAVSKSLQHGGNALQIFINRFEVLINSL